MLLIIADTFWHPFPRARWGKRGQETTGERNCIMPWWFVVKRVRATWKRRRKKEVGGCAGRSRWIMSAYSGCSVERNRVEGRCVGRMSDFLASEFLRADFFAGKKMSCVLFLFGWDCQWNVSREFSVSSLKFALTFSVRSSSVAFIHVGYKIANVRVDCTET